MNIYEAIKTLKDYCEANHVDCKGCIFWDEKEGCYMYERIPEEYETEIWEG